MTETEFIEIPGYLIQGLAGRGGMGVVYRAEQVATHRRVAIKLLTGGRIDPGHLAAFRREAATLAQLEHPHVVPLYDYGERDGVPYLVVRFLSGGTVADKLKSGPIEINTALRWIAEVADALDTAHRRGIIHRDVKPSNLLLDEAGNVYLGDFGIAAAAVDLRSAPHSASAAYASPEQARGEAPDPRSDVYSLAATTFEMLTGKKPYEADTALGMMVRHMHDPVPSAREIAPDLSEAVDAAIAAGMAKDRQARPASAGAFARSLREAGAFPSARTAESAPTLLEHKPVPSSSRRLILGLGLILGAACVIGLGILGGGVAALVSSPTMVATATKREPTVASEASTVTIAPSERTLPISDDFSDPSSGFAERHDADGQVAYSDDGTLQISVNAVESGIEWYSPYQGLEEQDLAISVQAMQLTEATLGEIGVICRWQDKDNYVGAAVRLDGKVSLLGKINGAEKGWQDWPPGVQSVSDWMDWHTLQLTCKGTEVSLAVDGTRVAAAEDPAPASGTLALMAGLLETGELIVAFDDLEVNPP